MNTNSAESNTSRSDRGNPLQAGATKVVRVAHLGGQDSGVKFPPGDGFEVKQAVQELFTELDPLNNGTVVRLEFRRGLPCLLESRLEKRHLSRKGEPTLST